MLALPLSGSILCLHTGAFLLETVRERPFDG
jgi:hypothetical protein